MGAIIWFYAFLGQHERKSNAEDKLKAKIQLNNKTWCFTVGNEEIDRERERERERKRRGKKERERRGKGKNIQ